MTDYQTGRNMSSKFREFFLHIYQLCFFSKKKKDLCSSSNGTWWRYRSSNHWTELGPNLPHGSWFKKENHDGRQKTGICKSHQQISLPILLNTNDRCMKIVAHDTGIHTRVRISRSENMNFTDRYTHIHHLLGLRNYSRIHLPTYLSTVHRFLYSITYISFHLSLQLVTIWNVLYSTCSLLLQDIIKEDPVLLCC